MAVAGFLQALSSDEEQALRGAGVRRLYGGHVTLFHQGDDPGPVVLVLRGRVKVTAAREGSDREALLAVRGPGDLLGELAAIDDGPRSTTVTTLEPVEVLLVPRSEFSALLERRPRLALVILRMVAGRLRYADAQRAEFSTHDVVGRLALRLLELCEGSGTPSEKGVQVDLPFTQEELASWVGASREAVSKGLQLLRTRRIVETGRRRITVLDMDALRRRAR